MRKIVSLLSVLMLFCLLAFGQTRTVTGVVRDEKGDIIPFANITEVGNTRNSVQADANGTFSIKVNGNAQLSITAAGHNGQTVTASGNVVNATLPTTNAQLTEVVVTTALGIKRESKELGYAATSINNKTLTQAKSVNVAQALNGKISGLNVTTTNSGVFENAKINIRGIRSLTGNNQPLLVVDGAPTPLSFLSSIPPDDVQDLTVLKSAASAAIYGPDAVNGVIVVTTKRGTGNRLSVTVSSAVEAARVAYFPKLQHQFGGGAGEVIDQYGNYGYVPYENQIYGPAFDGSIKEIGPHLEDGSVQTGPYAPIHKDDKRNFWNTGMTIQNSISISGQDFYASVEDAKIKGLMPNDQNRRTSFRFNGGKTSGKFSINYGLNYVLQNSDVVDENAFTGLFPAYNGSIFFLVLQTPDNVPLTSYKNWRTDKFSQFSNYWNEFAVNPYWVIGNLRAKGRKDDFIGNISMGYQLFPWLKANVNASTTLDFYTQKNTQAPVVVTDFAAANRNSTQYSNRPGGVFDESGYSSRINFDYFLSGDTHFSDFSVKYVVGGLIRQNRSKDVSIEGNNLVVPYLYNVGGRSGDAGVPLYPNGNYDVTSRLLSGYGSVGFGYKGFAFVEFTGRNDWDSRLLKQNRSFFYPSANASVVLSDAIPSLKNSNVISYAKVRAAYSKSGNVNVGVYSLNATYSQPAGFPYGNNAGFTANAQIPSPDLKPEFVITKEAGLELGFLKNRLNLEATYFYQNCNNQILTVSQSAATGYTQGLANAASFKNYGVETDLSLTPLVNVGKGRIDFKVNATYNNNEVTSTLGNIPVVIGGNSQFLQNSVSSPTANNIAVVGMPAFAFQLTDYNRDSAGHVIVDKFTGLPSESSDLKVVGRSLPLWIIGLTPSYSIGGFSVSMTWDYKTGNDFYAGIGSDMDFSGLSARTAEYGRQRFVIPNSVYNQNQGTNLPAKYVQNTNIETQDGNYNFWTGAATNTSIGTNYFSSAAAWRLREVNISYNLPLKWIGGGRVIKRLTVSAIGKNLLLLVPKSNQWGDPEFNSATGANTFGLSSSFQSPASRLFGGTITVQF